jgi:alpha-galactosidase
MVEAAWLVGTRTAMLVELPHEGLPIVRTWGAAPAAGDAPEASARALTPAQTQASIDDRVDLDLSPSHARGFQGSSGIDGAFGDGTGWAPRFTTRDVSVTDHGLLTRAEDADAGLVLHIELRIDEHDVVALRSAVTNVRGRALGGGTPTEAVPAATRGLGRPRQGSPDAASTYHLGALRLTLPVPDAAREVATFAGRWIREFHLQRQPWTVGRIERVNVRGRTSHEDPPIVFAGTPAFSEERGEVWAVHLGWSGNHEIRADRTADGFAYLQAAERLHPGELQLWPGDTYVTPWLYATASASGLNGVSDAFHAHVRARAVHPRRPRPVTLNTWEALYFDHDQERLSGLVDAAADLGVERFVLDDGWFRGRDDDTAGLGDWYVDERKHPGGLEPLASRVRSAGMEFGLWFEPEMVNPDSELYRGDPTRVLGDPEGPTNRLQHVLDIARPDVGSYLRERLGDLIAGSQPVFLKWDDNRDHVAAERDGVASTHAHVVALYELLDDLVAAHPELEIESCASGGGRIDLGILERTHRFWTSDNLDPIERQRMQRGASYLLPPELLGSHVGAPTSHTTSRTTSLAMRLATAFFGHFGIEWDLTTIGAEDRAQLRAAVELHRHWRGLLHTGRVVRVDHGDPNALVHGVVDEQRGLFAHAQLATSDWSRPATVRCPGLPVGRRFEVRLVPALTDPPGAQHHAPGWYGDGVVTLSGHALATHGVALHVHQPGTATVLAITAVD